MAINFEQEYSFVNENEDFTDEDTFDAYWAEIEEEEEPLFDDESEDEIVVD